MCPLPEGPRRSGGHPGCRSGRHLAARTRGAKWKCCFSVAQSCTLSGVTKYSSRSVVFSSFHDKVWGTREGFSRNYGSGELLNATTTIDAWVMVEDGAGAFGGTTTIPLYSQPFNTEWNDTFEGGFSRGFYRGIYTTGSADGTTTP